MQPMSIAVLERYVLSKPTFDPQGLIVATDEDKLVGFAHAGFGPDEQGQRYFDAAWRHEPCAACVPTPNRRSPANFWSAPKRTSTSRGARSVRRSEAIRFHLSTWACTAAARLSGVLDSDVGSRRKYF